MEKILKLFETEIREVNDSEHSLVALVSTSKKDRMDEVLDPEGADLKHFKKNPVVLFAHNYGAPPIGKALWIKKTADGILSKVKFATTAFAEEVYQLYKGGFMKAFSVGFIPKESVKGEKDKDPHRTYTKWELVEYSAVPVPANPEALALALRKGVIKSELMKKEIEDYKEIEKLAGAIEKGLKPSTKPEPEVTEKYIRIRIKNPGLFKKMRTMTLSASKGIKAIVGRLKKDDGKTHVQSVLFDKKKWTVAKAKAWIKEHKDSLKSTEEDIETQDLEEGVLDIKEETDETMDLIEALQAELEDIKQSTAETIGKLKEENIDLRYKVYTLSVKREKQTVSEMTDDEIVKTISDTVGGVIRRITGKVDRG